MSDSTQREARITEELSDSLQGSGLLVEDVAVTPVGKRRIVRVLVDRDLSAVTDETTVVEPMSLDEIASANKMIDERLESTGLMGEAPYVLEVSSPGVGRPLTSPRHFRRNVGRLISAEIGSGPVTGWLVRAGAQNADLEVVDGKGVLSTTTFRYAECHRASVQVEFARPPGGADDHGEADSIDRKDD